MDFLYALIYLIVFCIGFLLVRQFYNWLLVTVRDVRQRMNDENSPLSGPEDW